MTPSDALKALTWWRLRMMASRNERGRNERDRNELASDRPRHH